MIDASQIKNHMEVVGSDGQHVGTVDHLCIKLTRSDPAAGGKHHILEIEKIAGVEDGKVKLNMSAEEAKQQQKPLAQ